MLSHILSNFKTPLKTSRGFTLLEVLVSVAILGLIMVLVWSSSSQSLDAKERIEHRDMIFQQGRVAMGKISGDLAMAFLTKKAPTASQATATAPIEVSILPKPATFFIASDEGNRDSLRFTAMSHLRLFKDAKESDQCKVKYDVVSRPDEQGRLNLVRSELPWLDSDTSDVKAAPFVLAEDVREFDLEYYDDRKDEWVKSWDSENIDFMGRLPHAVSITIAFPDPDETDKDIKMKTIVLLPMSAGPVDF